MYCPDCKQDFDGKFCPECGTPLQEHTVTSGGTTLNLGDANAIMGGVHVSDSHNIHNDDHSVHNTTIVEAQRTQQEILQDNENKFIEAVRTRVADGHLTTQEEAELDQIARDQKIAPMRAQQIIEAERKSAHVLAGGQGNEYYASKVLQNIFDAVNANQVDIVKRLFKSVEELSKTMNDANVCYYHYMLYASLDPASCTVAFVNHHTDNYWQLFWTCIAYIKLGQVQNATALIPRLGGFGAPHGDIDLLTAVENLSDLRRTGTDYYQQQLEQNLGAAANHGMSEQLAPLWHAVQELTKEEQHPEGWFAFYVENTLAELGNKKDTAKTKGMPQMPDMPQVPQMPKFDPQAVQLKQSQGWSPLQAAQQMGLGKMSSMQQTQTQLDSMRSQIMGGMPPMPGMNTPPPMPQDMQQDTPPMPPMPTASSVPQSGNEEGEA